MIFTNSPAPSSRQTTSRTRTISLSQVFTYARFPLERMKSSVAIDTEPPHLPRAARAVELILEPTARPALAAAPTAERPAAAVERTMALPGRSPAMAPATPSVIDPSPDPAAPPTSALTILLVEKTTPTDISGPKICARTWALEGIPKRLVRTAAPAIVAATVRAAP